MKVNQKSISLTVAVISTSIMFSFGFFETLYNYGKIEFFIAYIVCNLLITLPFTISTISIDVLYPQINNHSDLVSKLTTRNRIKLLTLIIRLLVLTVFTIVIFNVSTYIIDFFDNIPAVNRLTHKSLIMNSHLFNIFSLVIIFVILLSIIFLSLKNKINFEKIIKSLCNIIIYLIIMFLCFSLKEGLENKSLNIFNIYRFNYLAMYQTWLYALLYSVLSSFLTISFYKSIFNFSKEIQDINPKKMALQISLYTIGISLILSFAIYSIVGGNDIFILNEFGIFNHIQNNNPIYYLLLELMYITFNILLTIVFLNYIYKAFNNKSKLVVTLFVAIPIILTAIIISNNINDINFVKINVLHLIIIDIFIIDIFIVGWLFDAQKLTYEIRKKLNVQISPIYNISIRILIPLIIFIVSFDSLIKNLNIFIQIIIILAIMIVYITMGCIEKKKSLQRKF